MYIKYAYINEMGEVVVPKRTGWLPEATDKLWLREWDTATTCCYKILYIWEDCA